uniref:CUB domain-containing protein n=1 Tax=Panagrellus redivivus TaxID=6233 RepID=A0A7E4VSQ5_PANRE
MLCYSRRGIEPIYSPRPSYRFDCKAEIYIMSHDMLLPSFSTYIHSTSSTFCASLTGPANMPSIADTCLGCAF